MTTDEQAFQDQYIDEVSHCYGCGRLNEQGLQIKSYWQGDEAVCTYTPRPYFTAIPGVVYGGLIASLIDCHSAGTAAAAAYEVEKQEDDDLPFPRYVTASLHVDYLKPTPIGTELKIRARVEEMRGRRVIVSSTLESGDQVCARGEVVLVRMPEDWVKSTS